jgi:hypothetical protein
LQLSGVSWAAAQHKSDAGISSDDSVKLDGGSHLQRMHSVHKSRVSPTAAPSWGPALRSDLESNTGQVINKEKALHLTCRAQLAMRALPSSPTTLAAPPCAPNMHRMEVPQPTSSSVAPFSRPGLRVSASRYASLRGYSQESRQACIWQQHQG